MPLTHWVVENSINTLNWTPLRPVSALILCSGFWRGPEILMMIKIACCECEMFVSLTRLSSTERIFADTSSIFMWSSSLCMSHAHLIFFKYFTVFFIFYCSTVGLGSRGNPSLKMPCGKLVCSYFSHSLSAGIKVNNFTQCENFGCLTVGRWDLTQSHWSAFGYWEIYHRGHGLIGRILDFLFPSNMNLGLVFNNYPAWLCLNMFLC